MLINLRIQAGFAAKSSQAVFDNIGTGMELLGLLLEKKDVLRHPEAARAVLLQFQSAHPEIAAMALINPHGLMLLNTAMAPGAPLPDLRRQPDYFHALIFDMNTTYSYNIGPNQYGMGLERWHFPFRHVVRDDHDNPLFVIQGDIPIESAGLLWSDLPLLADSRVGLMRNDGGIQLIWPLTHPDALFRNLHTGALVQAINTNVGKITGDFEGKDDINAGVWVGAYTHLPNANMAAYVAVPKGLLLSRWWAHNYPVLLSFLVYLGVIVIIAYRLACRERQHTHELLAESRKDLLTDLPNRIAADELIAMEIARLRRTKKHLALFYFGLDKFKDVNDSLGHANGDLLLQQVALRVKQILRDGDILARLGGDEFLVLIPDCSAEISDIVAQRLIDVFHAPYPLEAREVKVSASIGICLSSDHGVDNSALLQNAGTAMHHAKHQGGGCFTFYSADMGEKIHQRLQLLRDLQRALEREEFILHYQPLVDLPTGRIVGAEALVRWIDPVRGLRSPIEFIPCAEESGFIIPLGDWVLKTSCLQAKAWVAQGFDMRIAINLSTRQFQDPTLVPKIESILSETGLAPTRLELEITESAAMLDPEASIQVLGKLKSLGLQIAIDDFGTGYSSLSYLKRIPADIIKIDRSFVQGVHNDSDDSAIVRTVLALATALEKRCVAEGIETSEHFATLRDLGCHYGQGYWMSKPLPAAELEKLLIENPCYAAQ
jgi:diguanylate cyclase (GGDEF)-like protein